MWSYIIQGTINNLFVNKVWLKVFGFRVWWVWVVPQVFTCPLFLESYLSFQTTQFYHQQNGSNGSSYVNELL